ncbi:MAG TPA: hypothetical protein VKU85_20090, partial [bacterium]|nr:hypothetical protein [bacterium]
MGSVSADNLLLNRLRTAASDTTVRAPDVSGWSVGMHVHHCTLAMINIGDHLLACDSSPAAGRPSLIGSVLLVVGRIPRGRAQAPRVATPTPDLSRDDLLELLRQAESRLTRVADLPPAAWFRHFAFGVLNRDRALRFIRMHNDHHL